MQQSPHDLAASFKQRLRSRSPMHGFFIGQNVPSVVEMVGYAGFDFVIIDQEHGPADRSALEAMLRAADAASIVSIVRVSSSDARDILPVLDLGASGILVPHVRNAMEAADIVSAAHFPPVGRRGVSSFTRAGRYGLMAPGAHLSSAAARTSILAMIEDEDAVPHAGSIAATEGIDGIFVGPTDLAASLGVMGQRQHPRLLEAVAKIAAAVPDDVRLATTAQTVSETSALYADGFHMICHSTATELARALKLMKSAVESL